VIQSITMRVWAGGNVVNFGYMCASPHLQPACTSRHLLTHWLLPSSWRARVRMGERATSAYLREPRGMIDTPSESLSPKTIQLRFMPAAYERACVRDISTSAFVLVRLPGKVGPTLTANVPKSSIAGSARPMRPLQRRLLARLRKQTSRQRPRHQGP
jgi:hypothetical protein